MTRGRAGDRSGSRGGQRAVDRGLSPVLGVVLLIGIVVLGTVVVTFVGGVALDGSRSSVEISRAEGAMAELDARASDTALGLDNASVRDVAFGPIGRDGRLYTTHESWITVNLVDASTGVSESVVGKQYLGTVSYTNGETTIAYEGGGVWRADESSATMLSPPEFHFRNTTLTLPIINISDSSNSTLNDQIRVQRAGAAIRKYPNPYASTDFVNRVADSKVTVTIHSDYYQAWGQYFEDTTDGIVTYDHGAQTVTVKFLSLPREFSLSSGIVATSGSSEFFVRGTNNKADSYNSTDSPYSPSTAGDNGDVVSAGEVVLLGNMEISGDLWVGDNISIDGSAYLEADINSVEEPDYKPGTWVGSWTKIPGVASIEPIDGYVAKMLDELRSSNDNDASPYITADNELALQSKSATIENGSYFLERIHLSNNEDLILDTSKGDIVIVVENDISLKKGAIEVEGPGTVTVFLAGESSTGGDHHLDLQDGSVSVPGDIASQFRIYGTSHLEIEMTAHSAFVGVIYAPAGLDGVGDVYLQQSDIYGAVITGSLEIKQAGIHYDEALEQILLPRSPTVSRLEYMHVAVHEVDVTNR